MSIRSSLADYINQAIQQASSELVRVKEGPKTTRNESKINKMWPSAELNDTQAKNELSVKAVIPSKQTGIKPKSIIANLKPPNKLKHSKMKLK